MPERDGSIRYVTNSELQTFKKCRRKWWLAYWRKLAPVREEFTGVRSLGTRLHASLAVRYRPGGTAVDALVVLEDGIAADLSRLDEMGDQNGIDELHKDAELARIMLEGYFDWVEEEGVDIGLEIIGDEQEVSAPFAGHLGLQDVPVHLLGRLDVRARREIDGARFFIDHKSVGSFSQAITTLHMDEQMLMYHLLEMLEQLARGVPTDEQERCDGGIYNMLRRVKRSARAKPPFYAREEVHHNVHELRSFYQRVDYTVREILELERKLTTTPQEQQHLVAYPSPTRDCTWSCDYFHVCHMLDDGSHAEGFITTYFASYDPLARYATQESGLEEGETE